MRTPNALVLCAVLSAAAMALMPLSADAQGTPKAMHPTSEPHLPPGPTAVGSADLIATSSSNESGSYLWIIGPAEHVVMLCEKKETEKDFTCRSKRLP